MRTRDVGSRVEDLERSITFYTSIGYEALGEVPASEFGTLTMLKLTRDEFVTLELVHDPNHGRVERGGLHQGRDGLKAILRTHRRAGHRSIGSVEVHSPLAGRRRNTRRALGCRFDRDLLEHLRPS